MVKINLFYIDRLLYIFEYKKMFKCLKWLLSYGSKVFCSLRYKLFYFVFDFEIDNWIYVIFKF